MAGLDNGWGEKIGRRPVGAFAVFMGLCPTPDTVASAGGARHRGGGAQDTAVLDICQGPPRQPHVRLADLPATTALRHEPGHSPGTSRPREGTGGQCGRGRS